MTKVKFLYYFSLLIGLCLSTSTAFAQSSNDDGSARRVWAGIAAGTNVNQISGDNLQGYRHFGWNAGVVSGIKIAPRLSASFEILYSVKGAQPSRDLELPYFDNQNKPHLNYKINLPYFELPIYLSYYDKNKSSLGVGVSYGRLFNPTEQLDSVNFATTYLFNKTDWNILFNGTLAVYKNKGFINLRNTYSLNNIRMIQNTQLPHFGQQFNKTFALRALYLF
jgi:Outer membrane protein beta-barrel domain